MSTPTIILVGRIVKIKKDGNLFNAGTTKNGKNYIQFRILCSNRVKNPDGSWKVTAHPAHAPAKHGTISPRTSRTASRKATSTSSSATSPMIVSRIRPASPTTRRRSTSGEAGPSLKWGTAQLVNANQQAGPRQASTTPAMAPQAGSDPWGSSGFDGFGQPAGEPAF